MKKILTILYLLIFCFPCFAAQKYYSIQVISDPDEKKPLAVYQDLTKKGYFAYAHNKTLENGDIVSCVKVGIFNSYKEAEKFGKEFKNKTGMDYFADYASAEIDSCKSGIAAVTTTHDIWIYNGKKLDNGVMLVKPDKWVYSIDSSVAKISPDGSDVVYTLDDTIYKFRIEERKLIKLRKSDDLWNSELEWSPDGKYIAYVDAYDFEHPTSLWVMDADGKNNKVLVKNGFGEGTRAVGRFMWHPEKDIIYYGDCRTYGTGPTGEKIYKVDLNGKRELVLPKPGSKKKVWDDFRIENEKLFYKFVEFPDDGKWKFSREYSEKIE